MSDGGVLFWFSLIKRVNPTDLEKIIQTYTLPSEKWPERFKYQIFGVQEVQKKDPPGTILDLKCVNI